jgi:hypothetical protein
MIEPEDYYGLPPLEGLLTDNNILFTDIEVQTKLSKNRAQVSESISSAMSGLKTKKGKNLKKEYVRTNIIRSHKKLMRIILKSIKCQKYLRRKFNNLTEISRTSFNKFYSFVERNQNTLKLISTTYSGPITDGKAKRKKAPVEAEKSFNKAFCKKYFSQSEVKESFYLFIEFLYSDYKPDRLKKILNCFCCQSAEHSPYCTDSWFQLKEFFQISMFEDLEIPPWNHFDLLGDSEPDEICLTGF